MTMTATWKKILIIGAMFLAPLLLAQCGSSEQVADAHVGPVGPTKPSGYYFDMTVTPHTLSGAGSVNALVRVWDSHGNMAGNVSVTITVTGGGTWDSSSATITTNDSGMANVTPTQKSAGTPSVAYITATVESSFLTIPIQMLGASGSSA